MKTRVGVTLFILLTLTMALIDFATVAITLFFLLLSYLATKSLRNRRATRDSVVIKATEASLSEDVALLTKSPFESRLFNLQVKCVERIQTSLNAISLANMAYKDHNHLSFIALLTTGLNLAGIVIIASRQSDMNASQLTLLFSLALLMHFLLDSSKKVSEL